MTTTIITGKTLFGNIFLFFFRLAIRYFAYFFFVGALISFVLPLIMLTAATGFEFSVYIFKFLGFLNPALIKDGDITSFDEIVQAFLIVSFVFMILGRVIHFVTKKVFHYSLDLIFRKKLRIVFLIVSIIYVFTLISSFFVTTNSMLGSIIGVFVFYSITLVTVFGYMCLSYAADNAGKTGSKSDNRIY